MKDVALFSAAAAGLQGPEGLVEDRLVKLLHRPVRPGVAAFGWRLLAVEQAARRAVAAEPGTALPVLLLLLPAQPPAPLLIFPGADLVRHKQRQVQLLQVRLARDRASHGIAPGRRPQWLASLPPALGDLGSVPCGDNAPVGWTGRGQSRGLNANLAVGCLDEDIEDCQKAQSGHLAIVTSGWARCGAGTGAGRCLMGGARMRPPWAA